MATISLPSELHSSQDLSSDIVLTGWGSKHDTWLERSADNLRPLTKKVRRCLIGCWYVRLSQ